MAMSKTIMNYWNLLLISNTCTEGDVKRYDCSGGEAYVGKLAGLNLNQEIKIFSLLLYLALSSLIVKC